MCNIWLDDRFSMLKQCLICSPLWEGVAVKNERGKTQKDIVGILQKQRSHPRLFDHGSGHQGSPAPEKLHAQNKLWAQQREQDDEYPSAAWGKGWRLLHWRSTHHIGKFLSLTWSPVPAKWIHTGLFFCQLLGTINWNLKSNRMPIICVQEPQVTFPIAAQTPNQTTDKLDKNTTVFKMIDSLHCQLDDRSQILPGFDSFWRKNSRNKVLKWRDEVPFMDITVTILLCLINIDTDSHQNPIRLGTCEERPGKIPCLCKLGSP